MKSVDNRRTDFQTDVFDPLSYLPTKPRVRAVTSTWINGFLSFHVDLLETLKKRFRVSIWTTIKRETEIITLRG